MSSKAILGFIACAVFLSMTHPVQAQGWGNTGNAGHCMLEIAIGYATSCNPGTGQSVPPDVTLATVAAGTQITIRVYAQGIQGGGYVGNQYVKNVGYVDCWAVNSEGSGGGTIFAVTTTTNLTPAVFTWTPTVPGSYSIFCSAFYQEYQGEGYGSATTGNIILPVS